MSDIKNKTKNDNFDKENEKLKFFIKNVEQDLAQTLKCQIKIDSHIDVDIYFTHIKIHISKYPKDKGDVVVYFEKDKNKFKINGVVIPFGSKHLSVQKEKHSLKISKSLKKDLGEFGRKAKKYIEEFNRVYEKIHIL